MNHPLARPRVPKYLLALNKFFMRYCLVPGTLMYLTRTCELKNKTTHLQYSGLAEWKGKCQSTEKSLSKYWTLFPRLYHLNWTFIRSLYYVKVVIISLRVSDLGGLTNKPPDPHCSLENCPRKIASQPNPNHNPNLSPGGNLLGAVSGHEYFLEYLFK